ncbi:GntP family permease [Anaerovibrio sp.]|uniref:GntP family permease n=1 Tax=Anaerovibrio sp. TaxID=1872532 RepID=UPI0025B96335|nr:GntP family permease [Anaerovibrio sp.]MBR2143536.1 GntP family permease [Anaerovibrio sp.]
MDTAIIFIALIGLMYMAYRGASVILVAPLFAVVAALGSEHGVLPIFSELYMTKAAEYVKNYYPIFLFGAVFARLMEKGGMAASVAGKIIDILGEKRAVLAVLLGCGALTYGGLSVFVVAFVMYPFGAVVFKKADIPKRLLPAALWMGIFSFAMVALPGTPQIQNIIPSSYFGTSTWSGIGIGLFASAIFLLMGWGWLSFRANRLKAQGEGYGRHIEFGRRRHKLPNPDWKISCVPLLMVIVLNVILSNPFDWEWGFHWDATSLESLGNMHLSLLASSVAKISAGWSISIALIISSIVAAVIARRHLRLQEGMLPTINNSAISSCSAVLNVASGYAFGCVVVSLGGFAVVKELLLNLDFGGGPLFSAVLTTNVMCGITGSASSGLTIALSMLGDQWAQMATAAGIPLEVLHRIVAVASVGIDPVPHAGALVTLLAICGLSHKESYSDIIVLMGLKFLVPFLCVIFYMITGIA